MLANLFLILAGVFVYADMPSQIKIAWTGNPGELVINWASYESYKPEIHYSVAAQGRFKRVYGTQKIFTEGLFRNMRVNQGTLTDLEHGESYTYYVGANAQFSDHYTFTYYSPNTTDSPRLALFGDWGLGSRGRHTLELLELQAKEGDLDGVLICGDLAYNMEDLDGVIGDKFFDEIQPVTAVLPTMVIPGNHDSYHNFSQVIERFSMPKGAYNHNTGLFYSMNMGPAHIVMFTDELYFHEGLDNLIDVQMAYLEADLEEANANRAERPWVIVMTHRPLYCSSRVSIEYCSIDTVFLQGKLEELLYRHKVDLMVTGHVHYYERDTAIYKDKAAGADEETKTYIKNAKAPVYIVSGNGGNIEGGTLVPLDPKPWSRFISDSIGYGVLHVLNSTAMYWKQYDAKTKAAVDHYYFLKRPVS